MNKKISDEEMQELKFKFNKFIFPKEYRVKDFGAAKYLVTEEGFLFFINN